MKTRVRLVREESREYGRPTLCVESNSYEVSNKIADYIVKELGELAGYSQTVEEAGNGYWSNPFTPRSEDVADFKVVYKKAKSIYA